ncbi:putative brassinosteroid-insensitive 1 [Hordeum vulgare]|nr:putative brassinosteroid-insensitive 1 [Hordeum vulgare]
MGKRSLARGGKCTGIASHAPSPPLEGCTAWEGACRFPGAVCRGGRFTSLSLAAVTLNDDFRAVANTLLQLSFVERLSLRVANVSGTLAASGTAAGSRSSTSPGMLRCAAPSLMWPRSPASSGR